MAVRIVAVAVLVSLAAASSAYAQDPGPRTVDVRFVPGLVGQGGVFGDDSPEAAETTTAFTLGFQVRTANTRRTGFSLELTLQPIGVRNPHFDESLHSLYVLAGAEIGRRTYVRPAAGVALQMFSGTFAAGPSVGLAFGVGVGHRRPVADRMDVGVEFTAATSASPGVGHWMMGVQVPIGWR